MLLKDIKVFLNKRKKKKGQYGCEHQKYISENRKQNLAEYRKKYKMRKSALL